MVGVENDNDVLSTNSCNYSGLSEEIGSGGIIELEHDYYTYDSGSTISITIDNSVIDGKGAVIDMDESHIKVFNIAAAGVTIKNLCIKNANSTDDGGAIYFSSSGSVENCNFMNNRATSSNSWGGAIRLGSGNISNCNFVNNFAFGDGGAIWMNNGNLFNCSFYNNSASNGGAIYISSFNVSNCNFSDNKVINDYGSGGAIWLFNTGNILNCNFVNNSASYGGAIRTDSCSLKNCNFTENSAIKDGGASNIYSGTVENCNYIGNNAIKGSAIMFRSSSTTKNISNSVFLNNRANTDAENPFEVTINETNIEIAFIGQNNFINAIYSPSDVVFTNVTYWGDDGIVNTNISSITN